MTSKTYHLLWFSYVSSTVLVIQINHNRYYLVGFIEVCKYDWDFMDRRLLQLWKVEYL